MEDRVTLRRNFGSSSHLYSSAHVSTRIPASAGGRAGVAVSESRRSFTVESRPLPTLRPLSASSRTLSSSTSSLLHVNQWADSGVAARPRSLLATPGGLELPKSRQKEGGGPFQVDLLKGLAGLGVKVKVMTSGHAQITEVTSGGPLDKNRQARVGDYLLAVNSTPLTGLTDSRVQQIMRLLPRGLNKLIIQANDGSLDSEKQRQNGTTLADRKSQEKTKAQLFPRYDALTREIEPTPSTQYSPEHSPDTLDTVAADRNPSGHDVESVGSVPVSLCPIAEPIFAVYNSGPALGSSPEVQKLQAGNSVTTRQSPSVEDSADLTDESRATERNLGPALSLLESDTAESGTPSVRHLRGTPARFSTNKQLEQLDEHENKTIIRNKESTGLKGETITPTTTNTNVQSSEIIHEMTIMTNAPARKHLSETTLSISTASEHLNRYPIETTCASARQEALTLSRSQTPSTADESRLNSKFTQDANNLPTYLSQLTPSKELNESVTKKDIYSNLDTNVTVSTQPSPLPTKAERNADSVAAKSEVTTATSDPKLLVQSSVTRGSSITAILQLNPGVESQLIPTTQTSSGTSPETLPLYMNTEAASPSQPLASTQSNFFIASEHSTNILPVTAVRSAYTSNDQLSSVSRDIEKTSETQQDYKISQSTSQQCLTENNDSIETPSPQGIDNYKLVVTEFRAVLQGPNRFDGRKQGVTEAPILKESTPPSLRPRILSASSYQDVSSIGKPEPDAVKLQAGRYRSNERLDWSPSRGSFQTPVVTGARGRSTSTTSLSTESENSKHTPVWAQKQSINNQNVITKLNQPDSPTSINNETGGSTPMEPGFGTRASSSSMLQKSRSSSTSSLDTIAGSRSPSHSDVSLRTSVFKAGQLNSALSPRSPLQYSPNSPSFVYPKRRVMQILEGSFHSNKPVGVIRSAAPKIIRTSSEHRDNGKSTSIRGNSTESKDLNDETVFFSSFSSQNVDTFVTPGMETDSSNDFSEKRNYEIKPESPVIMRPVPAPRKIKKAAQTDDDHKLDLHTGDTSAWLANTRSEAFGNAFVMSEIDNQNSGEPSRDSGALQTFLLGKPMSSDSKLTDSDVRQVPQQRQPRAYNALPGPHPKTEMSNTSRDSDSRADAEIRWASAANQNNSTLITEINPNKFSSFSLDNSNAYHQIARESDTLSTAYLQPTRNVTGQTFSLNTSDDTLTRNEPKRELDEGQSFLSSKPIPVFSDEAPPLPSAPPPQIHSLDLSPLTTNNHNPFLAENLRPLSSMVAPMESVGSDVKRQRHTDWFEDLAEFSFPDSKTHTINTKSSAVDQASEQATRDITSEVNAKLPTFSNDVDELLFPLAGISHQNEKGRLSSFDLLDVVSSPVQDEVTKNGPSLLEIESFPENEKIRASSPNLLDMMSEDSGMPADEDQELHTDDTISPPGEYADNAFGIISTLSPLDPEADILVSISRVTDSSSINSSQKIVGSNTVIESTTAKDMVPSVSLSNATIPSHTNSSNLLDDDFEYHNKLPAVLLPQSLYSASTPFLNGIEESQGSDSNATTGDSYSQESTLSFNLNDTTPQDFTQKQTTEDATTREIEAQLSETSYQNYKNQLVCEPSSTVLAVPVLVSANSLEHPVSEVQEQFSSKVQRHLESNIHEQFSSEAQRKQVSKNQGNLESKGKEMSGSKIQGSPVYGVHDQLIPRHEEEPTPDTRVLANPGASSRDTKVTANSGASSRDTRVPNNPGASSRDTRDLANPGVSSRDTRVPTNPGVSSRGTSVPANPGVSGRAWCLRSNTQTHSPLAAGATGEDLEAQLHSRESSFSKFISTSELKRVIFRANALLDSASPPDALMLQILHLHRDGEIVTLGVDIKQVGDAWFQVSSIREGSPVWQEGSVQLGDWLMAVDTMWSDSVTRMRLLSRLSRPKHDTLLVLAREVQPGTLERHLSSREQILPSSEPVPLLTDKSSPSTPLFSLPPPGIRHSPSPKGPSDLLTGGYLPGFPEFTSTDLEARNAQYDPESYSYVTLTSESKGSSFEGQVSHPKEGVHQVVVMKGAAGVGFSLDGGLGSPRGDLPITVKRIFKGGLADKGGQLMIGDEILLVNGREFSNMRHYEAWNFLKQLNDGEVHLTIRRL